MAAALEAALNVSGIGGILLDFVKMLLLGALQAFIYGKTDELVDYLKDGNWIAADGKLVIPAAELAAFGQDIVSFLVGFLDKVNFGPLSWLKDTIIGVVKPYLLDQWETWVLFLAKTYSDGAGGLAVQADQIDDFAKLAWKGLAYVLQHGNP